MILKFPELRGGPVQGLNDAGVENFQGAIDTYLSRECGQNTGDALRGGVETARLEFQRMTISRNDIPCFERLERTLQAALEHWGDKEKERKFFEQAVNLAAEDSVSVLKISDYGTTGLTGDDMDEKGRWFALVKSQGVSNKGDTAGGSFGIGKSSPFAASRFRTVFYGTRTEGGAVALQGVSRLVTHRNEEGHLTQGVGFIGEYDPAGGEAGDPVFRAIRREAEMPIVFRRTQPGTDIWVVGYRSGERWEEDLIRSILVNFWPAIYRGSIEFKVGDQPIIKDNLQDLIASRAGSEEFDAQHYYNSILNQPATKKLRHVGQCELYLTTSSQTLPKRICMSRKSGMRIYDYAPRSCRVPFSGLFICADDAGNKLLRQLEPPKHDTWDPKRMDKDDGKKALDEIKLWIREELKKLNPLEGRTSFNETELARFLPEDEAIDNLPSADTGDSSDDGLEPRPSVLREKPMHIVARQATPSEQGSSEGGAGHSDESGVGGKEGAGSGDDGTRTGSSTAKEKPPVIDVRSYCLGNNLYQIVMRSSMPYDGRISILAMGEDGRLEPVRLTEAAPLSPGAGKAIIQGHIVEGLRFDESVPVRLSLTVNAAERRSLTVKPVP